MKLNITQVKALKAKKKQYKVSDGKGLFMLVHPNGSKYWRLAYRFEGTLNAIITSNDFRYGMSRVTTGGYRMYEFNYEFFPPTDILDVSPEDFVNINEGVQDQGNTYTSHLKTFDFSDLNQETRLNTTNLDALIVWTEDARVAAGGVSGDPNDTAAIEALMVTAVDHSNTTFSNSSINTRLTKFHTAKYNGFTYSGNFTQDLNNLRDNAAIKALRNQVGADTVIAIIGNDFTQFQACGVAFSQTYPGCSRTSPIPGCDAGAAFKEASYAITAQFCAISDDSFTHELGHNMGANHVPGQSGAGWEDDVMDNGFPDPFGHLRSGFKTLMAVNTPTEARRMNFSNPNVQIDGVNSGILHFRDNARVIELLTPAMSVFGTRPDLIFEDGF